MGPEGDFDGVAPDLGAGDFGALTSGLELLDSDFAAGASDFGAEGDSDDGVDDDPLESFDFSARLSLR